MMRRSLHIATLLMSCLFACKVSAQDAQTGTIEQLDQDNGTIVISGRALIFSEEVTQVFYGELQISSANVDQGMIVRYTLDESGAVRRIELIGPSDALSKLDQH